MTKLKTPAIAIFLTVAISNVSLATNPNEFCGPHDEMVKKLTGHPHYEQQISISTDENRGGLIEVFVNPNGRRNYTILWTRSEYPPEAQTCILVAGESFVFAKDNTHAEH